MIYVGNNEISGVYIGDTEIYGIYCGDLQLYPMNLGNVTAITISGLTWVTDVSANGGTADSGNCSFTVVALYDSGKRKNVTRDATVSGSLVVSATTATTREMVGTLTLTASYSGFTDSDTVDVYQKPVVHYITSLTFNKACINTGIKPTLNTRSELYGVYYPSGATYQIMFGANNNDTSYNWYRIRTENKKNYLNAAFGTRANVTISYPIQGNFYFDKTGLVYEHTDLTTQSIILNTTSTNTINYPIYVAGVGDSSSNGCTYNIQNFTVGIVKIYDNGVLVRDLRPALDNNNVACYYDEVTQAYFYKSGSGTITGNE